MEQRISLITLGVQDLPRALAFYAGGLGWQPHTMSNDDVTFFQLGAVILGLYPLDKLAEDAGMAEPPVGFFRGVALAYNVRQRQQVLEVLDQAEKAGGRITRSAQEMFWGGYSGYFSDPEGNSWEVAWNPAFVLADDGSIALPQ